jgi:parallel beta-helix repeat protein
MRQTARLGVLVSMCTALVVSACGGGGGDSSAPPPPNPLFVSAQRGSNTNLGDYDHPLRTISRAAQLALDSYTIYVGPGTYDEPQGVTTNRTGPVPKGVAFIADPLGIITGDTPGAVVLDVSAGSGAGFNLSNAGCTRSTVTSCSIIDGFEIIGAHDAGIVLKSGSNGFIIQNCVVHDGMGDGIRVQDSANVLLFNNLVYNNKGNGIGIVGNQSGSADATVVNNTVFGSQGYGIVVGTTNVASQNAFVHNNILQNDAQAPIKVTSTSTARSEIGYDADYNLAFAPAVYFEPTGIPHPNDVNQDARFVNSAAADFHLAAGSPALDAGGSLSNVTVTVTGIAGQRQSVPVTQILGSRTATGVGADTNAIDLGYHYPLDTTAAPNPLYVSAQRGNNTNLGDQAHPLRTISRAAQLALDSYTIYVGPGTYVEPQDVTTNRSGPVPQGVAFIADPSGIITGDTPGAVVLDVSAGSGAGFNLSNTGCTSASCSIIDGFEIIGAHDAGIVIKSGSNGFIIQNCVVHDGVGDGMRVQDSANVLLFNNLVYNNKGNGIGIVGNVSGSADAAVVNNTVFGSQGYGIVIGTTNTASAGAFVHNNILHNSTQAPIKVTSTSTARSEIGYDADYNLAFAPAVYFEPPGIPHPNDVNQDARFVNPAAADFHLGAGSPALDAGGPLSSVTVTVTGTSGQRQSVPVTQILGSRTATGRGPNTNAIDLGYHYPL